VRRNAVPSGADVADRPFAPKGFPSSLRLESGWREQISMWFVVVVPALHLSIPVEFNDFQAFHMSITETHICLRIVALLGKLDEHLLHF